MKNIRSILSLVLTVCLLLAGSSALAADAEPMVLSVWCWSPNEDLLTTGAEMYKEADLGNVQLDITVMALADVRTKIATITSSGDLTQLPDVILMQDTSIPMMVRAYGDAFADLSNSGVDTATFDQAKIAWDTYEGKLYGIPFDSSVGVACYRTDYLEQAGYSLQDLTDVTWDDFQSVGAAVLEKTGHPLISTPNDATLISMMLMSAGGSLFNEDGSANLKANEKLNAVIDLYSSLVNAGTVKVVTNWDEYMSSLNAGTSAGTMNGMWIMNSCKDAADQSGLWGVTNLPAVAQIEGASNYASSGGSSWMITSKCENLEGTVAFLTSIMGGSLSDEYYAKILSASNYIAAYLPTAGSAEVYGAEDAFFGNQKVFETLGSFVSHMLACYTSAAYDETQDALMVAVSNILGGADMQSELDAAQDTVDFISGM
ncbi:MAG: ABC transporter substrate-binding protein [Eubacteriales bacterium]|nr:ABC transporter substrate-binding protein [Eubacteriales bacterium]